MKIEKDSIWVSWNENLKHEYSSLYTIENEEELVKIISKSDKVRFFGTKQSSSNIAAGVSTLIDMNSYNKILEFNPDNNTVTVQAGIKLGDFLEFIESKNLCIPCLPDINTVSLGGALATGTHGTSGKLLSQYMIECRLVLANGEVKVIKESDEMMDALRVSLGCLGVMSTVTFKCEPNYTLHIKEAPQDDKVWLSKLKERLNTHDFLRILWLPHTSKGYVITGDKIDKSVQVKENLGPSFLKYRRAASKFLYSYSHKYPWTTAIANKLLYLGFFTSKKSHKGSLYQATVTKSRGSTLELAEWTVDLDKFPEVFKELKAEINKWSNRSFIHIPMDIRFVSKDNSWLSYAYKKDIVTMGCVSRSAENADSYEAFKTVERIFLKYGGTPHWGKRFEAKDRELSKLYPKWQDFKTLRRNLDPTGKFLNPYLETLFNEQESITNRVIRNNKKINKVA